MDATRLLVALVVLGALTAAISAPAAAGGPGLTDISVRQTAPGEVQVQVTALPGLRNPPARVYVAAYHDGERVAYVEAGELTNDGREVLTTRLDVPAGRLRIVATARDDELATTIDTTPPMPTPVLKRVEIPAGEPSTITIAGSGYGDRVAARLVGPDALDPDVTGVTNGELVVQSGAVLALADVRDPTVEVKVTPPADAAGESYRLTIATEAAGAGAVNWQAVAITVTDSSPVAPYRAPDGTVTMAGLRRAIRDWTRGDIGSPLLRQVIRAWAGGGS